MSRVYPPWSLLPQTPTASPPPHSPRTFRDVEEASLDDGQGHSHSPRLSLSGLRIHTPKSLRERLAHSGPLVVVALISLLLGYALHSPSTPPNAPQSWAQVEPILHYDFNTTDESEALPPAIAKSLRLTYAQCDAAFPKFWPQIEQRRVDQEREGGVRIDQLDAGGGGARVALVGGDLFVKKFEPFGTRTQSVLGSLHDAVTAASEPMPDVDFYFQPLDKGYPGPVFETVQPRPGPVGWLVPDFGFYSWPEPIGTGYTGVLRNIERVEAEVKWQDKIPKLFWRGAFLAPIREALRVAASGQTWGDIGAIEWKEKGKGSVPLWDHCRYKYLAHAEGYLDAYSGRMKYLLNCRSVVISHELHWDQHFHPAFDSNMTSPNQNIVILGGKDWDELPSTMEFLEKNPERAELIANNARRTLQGRYLTPAATACYWRRALLEYSKTQRFTPEIGDGKDYESFMLMGRVHWDPS